MAFAWPPLDVPPPTEHSRTRGRRRRRVPAEPPPSTTLVLSTAGVELAPFSAVHDPLLSELAGADLCHRLAELQWRARRPARHRIAAWWAWRRERRVLDAQAVRVRERARTLGLAPIGGSRRDR